MKATERTQQDLVDAKHDSLAPAARELYSEADEARMDIVGQNGNTAEHYEQILEDTQGGGHD